MRSAVPVIAILAIAVSQQETPRYELVEELNIQSSNAPAGVLLTRISDLALLSDGSIVAAHPDERVIRVFDQNGKFATTIGRSGAGPGEFSNITAIGTIGDTIWAQDASRASVSFFLPDGGLVRTARYALPRPPATETFLVTPRLLAALPGGKFLYSTTYVSPPAVGQRPASGAARDSVVYFIADSVSASRRELVKRPKDPAPAVSFRVAGGFLAWMDQPLMPRLFYDVAPGSQRIVFSCDGNRCGGPTSALRIWTSTPQGPLSMVDVPTEIRPLTTAQVDSVRRLYGPVTPPPGATASQIDRAAIAAAMKDQLYVGQYPPIASELIAGRDSSVWISDAGRMRSWMVIERGRIAKRVTLTAAQALGTIHQATSVKVWAVLPDSDDVPTIRRYGVRPVR